MIDFQPSFVLLPVSHIQQQSPGDCLAACAAMALSYLGRSIRYNHLVRLLRIKRPYGTSFSNIRELEKQQINVLYKEGTLPELYKHLCNGTPCIVSVQTGELPYWDMHSLHVVLLVGMDPEHVYLNDPEFANAPIRIPTGEFDLAWFAQEERYAVLTV